MQNTSEDGYQIATLVVIVLIVLVVVAYLLVFINPRIALNPFKPPLLATPTLAVAALPALPPTWTPTPSVTATPTLTATPTSTPTLTPSPSPTAEPASATPATPRSPTRTPAPIPPTPIPLPYAFRPALESCTHSGSTVIKGRVTSGGGPADGVHIRLATSPDPGAVVDERTVGRDSDGSTTYAFVLSLGSLAPFNWYLWVTDAQGATLSDPNFHISMNDLPAEDPQSCWLAVVNFAK